MLELLDQRVLMAHFPAYSLLELSREPSELQFFGVQPTVRKSDGWGRLDLANNYKRPRWVSLFFPPATDATPKPPPGCIQKLARMDELRYALKVDGTVVRMVGKQLQV